MIDSHCWCFECDATGLYLQSSLGVQSVKALCAGKSAKMVGILNNAVANTPIQNVVKQHVISDELQGLLSVFCR